MINVTARILSSTRCPLRTDCLGHLWPDLGKLHVGGRLWRLLGLPWLHPYHTGRFTKVTRLAKLLRVPTPANRGAGQPWRPGTPPPAPIPSDTPSAEIRVGYARCSHLTQELQSQLDALAAHGIPRDKIFAEKVSTRVRVRPKFEAALDAARQIKAHAPHCRVILTVYEMKRLGRDSAELTALADHLTAHGIALEMLAGPLTGIYDPTGTGRVLFAFFAAMAETERENIREATLEGLKWSTRSTTPTAVR
jgi:Resolvase, N terminal domain